MMNDVKIDRLLHLAEEAGTAVMDVYNQKFSVDTKADRSPITEADKRSNQILVEGLRQLYPGIPIISEESKQVSYKKRREWDYFWLVDPLDGTKEFVKKNGEFTINIALIHKTDPVAGVVYLPEQKTTYYATRNKGSYKIDKSGHTKRIQAKLKPDIDNFIIVGSRSHASDALHSFVEDQKQKYKKVELVSRGSSIKFCLVAEGSADVYLRTGPTMEWDTAAGHAIVIESGKQVYIYNTTDILSYNKETLRNHWFLVR